MAGIVNAVISMAAVQMTFVSFTFPNAATLIEPTAGWAFAPVLLVLGTVGVSIGRFVRLNSWDLVNPIRLFRVLFRHVRAPGNGRAAAGFVATYSVFLAVLYVSGCILINEALFAG